MSAADEVVPSWWCWGCGAPRGDPAPGTPCPDCDHSAIRNYPIDTPETR